MKTKILFVDDEILVLRGLKRSLQSMQKDAEMYFVSSGQEALDLMAIAPCDVVISDMRMPGLNGAELLEQIKQRYPQTVRFILSGHSDDELILRSVKSTHQFLSKPCDPVDFKERLALILTRGGLQNIRVNQILSEVGILPSAPALYQKVLITLGDRDAGISKVADTISQDIAMTATILKLVNSSYFGLSQVLTSAIEATNYLGLETIRALVLGVGAFTSFEGTDFEDRALQELWRHSLKTAFAAKAIALAETLDTRLAADCFTAGLLHDIGKLALSSHFSEKRQQVIRYSTAEQTTLLNSERQIFGADHTEIGAALLSRWGLPKALIDAAAYHHAPAQAEYGSDLSLPFVHAANVLVHLQSPSDEPFYRDELDWDYLTKIGLNEHVDQWSRLCK